MFGDVSKALGFIDWATKCVEGITADFYGLVGYQRWAKRQYCNNNEEIQDIKDQVFSMLHVSTYEHFSDRLFLIVF